MDSREAGETLLKPDSPLVTVGLSVYNGGATLADAVNSLCAQTYENWELLLIDDGSRDESVRIAKSFRDSRIVILSDGENKGLPARLNEAVARARGKYFCRMDQDDIAFPQRLARQVEFLEAQPEVDLIASSVVVFRDDGSLTGVIKVSKCHEDIVHRPWKGFYFPHPTWMGKKSWFMAHRYQDSADGAEDQLLLYNAFETSRFAGLREVLLAYRENSRSFRKMYRRRLVFWRAICKDALGRRRVLDVILISIFQPLRIVSDFLNIGLGIKSARNTLARVDAQATLTWLDMRNKLDVNHTSASAKSSTLERK